MHKRDVALFNFVKDSSSESPEYAYSLLREYYCVREILPPLPTPFLWLRRDKFTLFVDFHSDIFENSELSMVK